MSDLTFSPWVKLFDGAQLQSGLIPDAAEVGVYALAVFLEKVPRGAAHALSREIIYFGMTQRQSFKKRMYQFERAAIKGIKEHAGGITYRQRYGNAGQNLWIATYPLEGDCIIETRARLISDYQRAYNENPKCNLNG